MPENEPLDQLADSKRGEGAVDAGHQQNVLLQLHGVDELVGHQRVAGLQQLEDRVAVLAFVVQDQLRFVQIDVLDAAVLDQMRELLGWKRV